MTPFAGASPRVVLTPPLPVYARGWSASTWPWCVLVCPAPVPIPPSQAAGDALGALAKRRGPQVWAAAAPVVLANVEKNAALDESQRSREASRLAQQTLAGAAAAVSPQPPPPADRGDQGTTAAVAVDGAAAAPTPPPADGAAADTARDRGRRMVHETEGWRGLETSLSALAKLLTGAGTRDRKSVV